VFAISVRQPLAHWVQRGKLFCLNQNWETKRRPKFIAVHASQLRSLAQPCSDEDDLVFGAIVAVAHVAAVLWHKNVGEFVGKNPTFAWLLGESTSGPFVWVFNAVWPMVTTVPMEGYHGCFNVPTETMRVVRQMAQRTPLRCPVSVQSKVG